MINAAPNARRAISEGINEWLETPARARFSLRERAEAFFARPRSWPYTDALKAAFGRGIDGSCPDDVVRACRDQATKRRARKLAQAIGLVYWPALIERHGVDLQAFVAAEAVLVRRYGEWNPPHSHGGWDAMGHHGLWPRQVRDMWLAAGCRDSRKFRAQVALGVCAKKGDTLTFLRNLARGRRWLDAWAAGYGRPRLARKAVAALGRLSPELRHAAVRGLEGRAVIRIRDLNWAEAARIQALRLDDSDRNRAVRALEMPSRPAWTVFGQAAEKGADHPIQDRDVPELLPQFPLVSLEIARRIMAGEPPASIAGGLLDRREAHQWAREGCRLDPVRWLVRGMDLGGFVPRDVAVARWLLDVSRRGSWSALLRVEIHPDGRQLRRLDVLDEIQAIDLDRGAKTGVERAFDRAAERLMKIDEGDASVISHWPPHWPRLPRFASLLKTPAALAAEGKLMAHCVGGYAQAVKDRRCWIVSLVSRHGRSTLEIRPDGDIAQHKGARNAAPPRRHVALMRAWQNRLNGRRQSRRAA